MSQHRACCCEGECFYLCPICCSVEDWTPGPGGPLQDTIAVPCSEVDAQPAAAEGFVIIPIFQSDARYFVSSSLPTVDSAGTLQVVHLTIVLPPSDCPPCDCLCPESVVLTVEDLEWLRVPGPGGSSCPLGDDVEINENFEVVMVNKSPCNLPNGAPQGSWFSPIPDFCLGIPPCFSIESLGVQRVQQHGCGASSAGYGFFGFPGGGGAVQLRIMLSYIITNGLECESVPPNPCFASFVLAYEQSTPHPDGCPMASYSFAGTIGNPPIEVVSPGTVVIA